MLLKRQKVLRVFEWNKNTNIRFRIHSLSKNQKKKPIHLAYFENSLQLPQDSENKEVQIFDIFTLSAENSRAPGQIQLL